MNNARIFVLFCFLVVPYASAESPPSPQAVFARADSLALAERAEHYARMIAPIVRKTLLRDGFPIESVEIEPVETSVRPQGSFDIVTLIGTMSFTPPDRTVPIRFFQAIEPLSQRAGEESDLSNARAQSFDPAAEFDCLYELGQSIPPQPKTDFERFAHRERCAWFDLPRNPFLTLRDIVNPHRISISDEVLREEGLISAFLESNLKVFDFDLELARLHSTRHGDPRMAVFLPRKERYVRRHEPIELVSGGGGTAWPAEFWLVPMSIIEVFRPDAQDVYLVIDVTAGDTRATLESLLRPE